MDTQRVNVRHEVADRGFNLYHQNVFEAAQVLGRCFALGCLILAVGLVVAL